MRFSLPYRHASASALCVRVGALGGVCWALAAPLQAQTVAPAAPIGNATEASETDSAFWSRQERLEAAQIPSLQKRAQSAREMWNKASAPALARLRAQPVSAAAVGVTFAGQQTRSAAQWEVAAPRVALAFYGRWLTEEAQQLWPQGQAASRAPGAESYTWVQVCSIAAQLQARDVGEPRAALAIYDWALQSGADIVALSRLELERDQLIAAQRDQLTPAALPAAASVAVPQVGPMPPQASEKARSSWPAPLQPQASPAVARAPMITLSTGALSPIVATSPQTITLPTGATLPQMMTPATTAVGALGTPSPVLDAAFVRSSGALGQIRAGVLSPAAAWQRGDLRAEDAVAFLQSGSNLWIDHESESRRRLHHAFAEVLVRHASERLAPLSSVPPRVRLWMADYYGSRGDAHTLEVAESLISEFQNPQGQKLAPGQMEMLYQVVQRLAWFYREQGQPEKAAQAWERLPELVGVPGWWKPDALLEAARLYTAAGQEQTAKTLYAQVPQYGHGWFSVLSLYDQAQPLILAGKLEQARALLSRPLQLTSEQSNGQIAQNAWLASLVYQQGDLDAALLYGERVKEAAKAGPSTRASVNNLAQMGLDIYNRAGGWRKQPIQSETKEVIFEINPNEPNRTQYKRFRIKTYGDFTIKAMVAHPAVQVRVRPLINWQRSGLSTQEYQTEIILQTSTNLPVADVPLIIMIPARGATTTLRLALVRGLS